MEQIIAAAIAGSVTLLVCVINNHAQMRKLMTQITAENEKTVALLTYRLAELEKKQDKHNNLIDRVTTVEIYGKETRKDVDELFKRVREVEKERAERRAG